MARDRDIKERGRTGHSPASEAGVVSRRELMQRSALAAGTLVVPNWAEALGAGEPPKAKVVVVTTKEILNAEKPIPQALIDRMVEKGVTTLAGKSDPIQAWTTFVRPTDSVCLPTAGGQLENVPEVNIAVYKALARLGVNKMTIGTHRMTPACARR